MRGMRKLMFLMVDVISIGRCIRLMRWCNISQIDAHVIAIERDRESEVAPRNVHYLALQMISCALH